MNIDIFDALTEFQIKEGVKYGKIYLWTPITLIWGS